MEVPTEASMFESSEILATFLASTPLLSESWRLCNVANNNNNPVVVDRVGEVGYVAFSSASAPGFDFNLVLNENSELVPIHHNGGLFSSSLRNDGDEDDGNEAPPPPMVHAAFLALFLSLYNNPDFQNQMSAMMEHSKAVVLTGHSIGGTTASLATLWLLSHFQSLSSHPCILCITFGSPLLGNESLSRAILRERWGGKFCNVVSNHDIVPRLLFLRLPPLTPHISHEQVNKLLRQVLSHIASNAITTQGGDSMISSYRPFGSYLFCSKEGAICLDNAIAVVKMLHLMFIDALPYSSCIEDHFRYGEVVTSVPQLILNKRCFTLGVLPESSYEAGISLALEASALARQDFIAKQARECLVNARQMGRAPNHKSANLAIRLAKITPYRAEIEWYKALCDDSDDQMGYYDSFKSRGASIRDGKVHMNCKKLGKFWDGVLEMIETNQLPHDFHKRAKWVNASQFYKLLVEPLDIANYYRATNKGHYLTHGRARRYKIFDKWWKDRGVVDEENYKRSKYAGLTQDSCFWAKVEEANEWVKNARVENNPQKLVQLWENIENFELYAERLVDNKEVSKDVVAKNSSYSVWMKEWKELKSQFPQTAPGFPGYSSRQVVP